MLDFIKPEFIAAGAASLSALVTLVMAVWIIAKGYGKFITRKEANETFITHEACKSCKKLHEAQVGMVEDLGERIGQRVDHLGECVNKLENTIASLTTFVTNQIVK
jgi:hypothetical protein